MYIISFYYPLHARTHGKLSENVDTWEPIVNRWVALYGNYQWSSSRYNAYYTQLSPRFVVRLGKRLPSLITNGGETLVLGTGSHFSISRWHLKLINWFCFRESVCGESFLREQVMKRILWLFGFLLIEVQGQRLARRSCPERPVVKNFDVSKVSAGRKDVLRLLQYFP